MKQLLRTLAALCFFQNASAQWRSDFNTGDLEKDFWIGAENWTIDNGRLRSNGPALSGTCILLSREVLADSLFELRFWANPMLATSSNNFMEMILDEGDDGDALVIKLGGTADEVSLFRRRNQTDSLLIDGEDRRIASSSNNPIAVRLRTGEGEITLDIGLQGDTLSWLNEGHCQYPFFQPKRLSIRACYSAANAQKFFLDALYLGPHEIDTIDYSQVYVPNFKEIIITELMPDPSPSRGLPELEYIELYNASNQLILLKDFVLTDLTSSHVFPQYIFPSQSYLILTSTGNCTFFKDHGPCLELSISQSFLNNAGDVLTLMAPNGDTIEFLEYSDKWYGSIALAEGGYSLEKIDYLNPCVPNYLNYRASISGMGGTPGMDNSIQSVLIDSLPPQLLSFQVWEGRMLKLELNEKLEPPFGALILNQDTLPVLHESEQWYYVLFKEPLPDDARLNHTAALIGLTDCSGNTGKLDLTFRYAVPVQAAPHQLVFTEVMFRPGNDYRPFIEIHNRSLKAINLQGVKLIAREREVPLSPQILFPGANLIICRTADTLAFSGLPYQASSSLLTLDNRFGEISLWNEEGQLLDYFHYSDTFFTIDQMNAQGHSLERTHTTFPCAYQTEWKPSNKRGGSPGRQIIESGEERRQLRLLSVLPLGSQTLILRFSLPLNGEMPTLQISQSQGYPLSWKQSGKDFNTWELVWSEDFQPGKSYDLNLHEVWGCNGEMAYNQRLVFRLPGENHRLLINEILFDPFGDEPDYVELYNAGEDAVDLKSFQLGNMKQDGIIDQFINLSTEGYLLMPGGYVVITERTHQLARRYRAFREERVLIVSSLPSFPNSSGAVILLDSTGKVLDSFRYDSKMHNKHLNDPEGVSLERIDPEKLSHFSSNWTSASANENHGTPGRINSQHRQVFAEEKKNWQLYSASFSPDGDGFEDLAILSYQNIEPGSVATIKVHTLGGQTVYQWANNFPIGNSGTFQWEGLDDYGIELPSGPYLLIIQCQLANGQTSTERLVLVKASGR